MYNDNMDLRPLDSTHKKQYNQVVTHVIQSWEWGEFRKSLGLPLLRYGIFQKDQLVSAFQMTLHRIPYTKYYVGYLPKGPLPDKRLAEALEQIGKEHHCAFIKVEPNVTIGDTPLYAIHPKFIPSPKPLFTKHNFVLDLTKSEEELLKQMHQKTRYNVRVAQKHGVVVEERTDDEAFEVYSKLYFETTRRQNYHGHDVAYHQKVWQQMRDAKMGHIIIAYYTPPGQKKPIPLTAWMLLRFKDTLYYPYGGSSIEYREVMANNLVAWEAIKLGKKLKCTSFDLWGALGPNPDPKDPWIGFHKFKQGYGGELKEYIGTYDLIFNSMLYWAFTSIDRFTTVKVFLLKLLGKQ